MTNSDMTPEILVEWAVVPGRQLMGPGDVIGKGAEKLNEAMEVIQAVAGKVASTIDTLAGKPEQRTLNTVEVTFGLKFDTEAGAFIAKAGMEASITVKMVWERPDAKKSAR